MRTFLHKLTGHHNQRFAVGLVIILAVCIRVVLLASGWPPLDSDQGFVGLMGMHIAYNHEMPIFYYGQGYMGAWEAYVTALMFFLFGVSTFVLQFSVTFMFAVFLITMYFLTRLIYGNKLALITIILLSLGSNAKLTHEMIALAGYTETLLFGSLSMLIAVSLASSSWQTHIKRQRRILLFGAWGLVSGIGLWTNLLVTPFVLMSGLLLLFCCSKELLSRAGILLLTLFLTGISPMIIYNATAVPGQDTLSYIKNIHTSYGVKIPFDAQVSGAFHVSLPTATGAIPLCSPVFAQEISFATERAATCTYVHTIWPAGLLFLWILAVFLSLKDIHKTFRLHTVPEEKRKMRTLAGTRLALLGTGAIVLMLFVISPNAALYPIPSSRYLIGLFISLPAILWPLMQRKLSMIIILIIGITYFMGTVYIFTGSPTPKQYTQQSGYFALQVSDQHLDLPTVRNLKRQQYMLINQLLILGIHTIYSDYWTCGRLMFQSEERIYCNALGENLEPGHNRYPLYETTVRNDPDAAFVFPIGSPQNEIVNNQIFQPNPDYFQHFSVEGYDIYKPASHIK